MRELPYDPAVASDSGGGTLDRGLVMREGDGASGHARVGSAPRWPRRGARLAGALRVRRSLVPLVAAAVAFAAVGCGRPEGEVATAPSGTEGSAAPTSAPAGAGEGEFGDLGRACGPAPEGTVLEATDVGVTDDSIQIGTISDPGFSGRPGLNQEVFDSAEGFTKWCNAAGGIYGRNIDLRKRDAKLTEYQPRMIEACEQGDFMLVGGGGVFDDQGQEERLACGLPNLAGFVVNPPAVESDLTIAPLLNEPHTIGVGDLRWLAEKFPEATQKIGILTAGVAATMNAADRTKASMAALGWKVVYDEKYNAAGEASWRGFAEGLKSSGARGVMWVADPGNLAALLKAMAEIEYHPDFVRGVTNLYDNVLLSEAGAAADHVFISGANYPFLDPELAKQNPATQQYLDIMAEYDPGGKIADLGVGAFSAWLLFAQGASECGADLTRDCVWEKVGAVAEWTGGGLHARQNLAARRASECFIEIEAVEGRFVLPDIGANEGVYRCEPDNVIDLDPGPDQGVKCANPAFAEDPKPSRCAP